MSTLRLIYEGCSSGMEGRGGPWDSAPSLPDTGSILNVIYRSSGPPQRSIEVALYQDIAILLLDWVENILYSALHLFELVEYRIKAVVNQPQNGPYIFFY
jgi:hypothetical protein